MAIYDVIFVGGRTLISLKEQVLKQEQNNRKATGFVDRQSGIC